MANETKILLVGESWLSMGTHVKGFNEFPTGFYEEGHHVLSAALKEEFDLYYMPSHLAATQFPDSSEELSEFNVVLFSDIGSDTLLLHPETFLHFKLRPNRLSVVKQYVHNGGGFGMIGGYMSFAGFGGKAHYYRTSIEEILPVNVYPFDDRVEVPEGFSPVVVSGNHPIISSITGDWPVLLGYNRLTAKDDADVVLSFEDDPILAVHSYGKGRTLAFASDCSPHWGSTLFTGWEQYGVFWKSAVRWLAGLL